MITFFVNLLCVAQKSFIYKQIDTTKLEMRAFFPENMKTNVHYPTIVFFFGGEWVSGTMTQFEPQAT